MRMRMCKGTQLRIRMTSQSQFVLDIRKIPASNLCLDTGYYDRTVVFFSLSKQMPGWYLKLGHNYFLPYPFQFNTQLI
jgi:hypothetical protein